MDTDEKGAIKPLNDTQLAGFNALIAMVFFHKETRDLNNCARGNNTFGQRAVFAAAYSASHIHMKKNSKRHFEDELRLLIDHLRDSKTPGISDWTIVADKMMSGEYTVTISVDEDAPPFLRNWLFPKDVLKEDAFEFVKKNDEKFLGGFFLKLEGLLYNLKAKGWIATGNVCRGDEVFNAPTKALLRMTILQMLMSSSRPIISDEEAEFRITVGSIISLFGVEMDESKERDLYVFGPFDIGGYPGALPNVTGQFISSATVGDSAIYHCDISKMEPGQATLISLLFKKIMMERTPGRAIAIFEDIDEVMADHIGKLFHDDVVFEYKTMKELELIRRYHNRYHVNVEDATLILRTILESFIDRNSGTADVVSNSMDHMSGSQ